MSTHVRTGSLIAVLLGVLMIALLTGCSGKRGSDGESNNNNAKSTVTAAPNAESGKDLTAGPATATPTPKNDMFALITPVPINGFDSRAFVNEYRDILTEHYNEYLKSMRAEGREGFAFRGGLLTTVTVSEDLDVEIYETAVYGHPLVVSPIDDSANGFLYRGTESKIECYNYCIFCRSVRNGRQESCDTLYSSSFSHGDGDTAAAIAKYWEISTDITWSTNVTACMPICDSLKLSDKGEAFVVTAWLCGYFYDDIVNFVPHTADYDCFGVDYEFRSLFFEGATDPIMNSYKVTEVVMDGFILGRGVFDPDGTFYFREVGGGINSGLYGPTRYDYSLVPKSDGYENKKAYEGYVQEAITLEWTIKEVKPGVSLVFYYEEIDRGGIDSSEGIGVLVGDCIADCSCVWWN